MGQKQATSIAAVTKAIADLLPGVKVVDSAEATAQAAWKLLTDNNNLSGSVAPGRLRCYVSDNPQRFREVGGRFLGKPLRDVTWVTPEQFFHDSVVHAAAENAH